MVRRLFSKITMLSLRFKWITIALAVLFLVLGGFAFTQFNQELVPAMEFPATIILMQAPGMEPDELMQLLTIPIESELAEIDEIVNVESTTAAGFGFFQASNDFGEDQDVIVEKVAEGIKTAWQASGLARPWETIDGMTLETTDDITPEAIAEAWEKWPYILSDLTLPQIFSLSAESVGALPEDFLATLPETTQRELLDVVNGDRELTEASTVPQSWQGLSMTSDLTPEAVMAIAATAPSLFDHFRNENGDVIESYIFAMSPEVIDVLPAELTADMSVCSIQQVDDVVEGTLRGSSAIRLPGAWSAIPPRIITFSFSDLPLAYVSISAEGYSTSELIDLVEGEIAPRLVAIDGVANASVTGGQLLPGDPALDDAAAEASDANAMESAEGTPLPGSSPWAIIGGQMSAMTGGEVTTYEDLTPELVNMTVAFVDSMGIPLMNGPMLLMGLQSEEAVNALPADTLAWMPDAYTEGLSDDLRAVADDRVAAETRYASVGEAAVTAEEAGRLPVYFRLFSTMGESFGLPLTLNSPQDLTPEIISTLNVFLPGGAGVDLLAPLPAAAWEQVPVETLGWLPVSFVDGMSDDVQAIINERAEAVGGTGALAAAADENGDLPPFFMMLAQQPLLGGSRLCGPEDISPELVATIGGFMPQTFTGMAPAALERLSPEALAAMPQVIIDELPEDLLATLEEIASDAGGLGSSAAASASMNDSSPSMPQMWIDSPQLPATAGEMVAGQYGASGMFNMLIQYSPDPRMMFSEITPEAFTYFIDNEEGFLDSLIPAVLVSLPQGVMDTLPEAIQEKAENAFVPTNAVTRTNGETSLLLMIFKDDTANTVSATHAVYDELDALQEEISGIETVISFEQSSFIEESIDGVVREGALGALFAVIVIYFFLNRSWRATVITAVSIPLSIMIAFLLMLWFAPTMHQLIAPLATRWGGIWQFLLTFFPETVTMNLLTLSGVTVAIGRVVDDSIVVLENIYRHIHNDEEADFAVREGTSDVTIAIFASTTTTIAVFLPIGVAGGLIGTFFIPFGMAVTYALSASFIVAITVIPVLSRWFVRREDMPKDEKENMLDRLYKPALAWALHHRAIVLGSVAVLFVGSLALMGALPQSFLPAFGEPQASITVSLPAGTSIIETNDLMEEFELYIAELEEEERLTNYLVTVGSSTGMEEMIAGGGAINSSAASLSASLGHDEDPDFIAQELREEAGRIFGADNVTVSVGSVMSTGMGGLQLVLSGDMATLQDIDDDVHTVMSQIEAIANVTSTLDAASQTGSDAMLLRVDGQTAIQYGAELETDDTLGITAEAKQAIIDLLEANDLLDEVTVSEGFQTEMQTEGFSSIVTSLGLAIAVVYIIMVLTFGSFVHPFTILVTVPLAVVGASAALFMSGRALDLSAMVGMLMLVGIVVTNGIVMIDRVQANRKQRGMNAYDALTEGAQTRLRPILMTALAAIFALIPLAAQLMGPGGAIVSASLGTIVIGGLLTSTFFTLLVLPVVYLSLDQLTSRGK